MTIKTIKTNDIEANRIIENKTRFIFRSDRDFFKEGDIIEFRVIKDGKEVIHKINSKRYVVTAVMDCMTAPIEKGFLFIAFRAL